MNALTTTGVVGLPQAESDALMAEVRSYLYDDSRIYTHHWQPGDLLVWDNRWIQHARTAFDESTPRTLRRTTML